MNPFDPKFGSWCFDRGIRVLWILPLDGAHDGMQACETLEQFIEDSDEKLSDVFGPMFAKAAGEWYEDIELIDLVLDTFTELGMRGILMQAEIQVREPTGKNSYQASWWLTNRGAIYAETLDELGVKLSAWADRMLASYKKRKKAKA